MPRTIADGEIRVTFTTSVANTSSPTVSEAETSATDITPFMRSLDTPLEGEAVDASDLSTAFNVTAAGRFGGSVNAQMYRDDTTDTAWTLFPRNTTGYLIIRRFGGSDTAIVASDVVEVWPVRVITRSPATLDSGSIQMFSTEFATTAEPQIDVTVAA